jgi:hypothetical protein
MQNYPKVKKHCFVTSADCAAVSLFAQVDVGDWTEQQTASCTGTKNIM